ncbi:MAG: hypothetical protein IBX64_06855 [Actinobacteria bacterium]|nr:hypothetical protein [Actinomycetota bacterium]
MKKTHLMALLALGLVLALAGAATAATSGNAPVSFSVISSMEITANSVNLGSLAPGTHDLGNKNPVTVSANRNWAVTAQAGGDFTDSATTPPTTLAISNLKMNNNTMSSTVAVNIASGSAGQNQTPNVPASINIPWDANLGGKTLSATITYTVIPQ